ncbi:MAG TPA: hypothetical protein PKA28_18160 [Methylomusa anaerophila]|uniref:Uncharacterized protein n=1 Tax=Methylomusa anaerophila TaxID=1930071 RepID=A0A348AH74_9FIRM|nr:hypothetical protein [Methylomusa anaerophila]BBB90422.1 hypothetical protein MAMMFC1_01073 [Methylomusa anaerophila]HML90363.1 hypothetical protein [Methylomusa anaerophila]
MADKKTDGRQECHKLIQELECMQGATVDIRVLGGWLFNGTLFDVRPGLATLANVTVISGGGFTLCAFDVDTVVINIKAITSVGKPV